MIAALPRAPLGAYGVLVIVGILVTALVWGRAAGRARHDIRLTIVYFCGLFGALVGAKLAFLLAEGWVHGGGWIALISGRSVTGALLGGYAAVEIGKAVMGLRRTTGDLFALVVPIGLLLGRVGCLDAGCCPGVACSPGWWTMTDAAGVARWPAVPAEMLFNGAFLLWALLAARRGWLAGNRFHAYLIGYGLFRFGHEFLRDDPRLLGAISGYHVLAVAVFGLGAVRFAQRRRAGHDAPPGFEGETARRSLPS